MSFCFLYNVVAENYSVQNSSLGGGGGGGGGSIASSRSIHSLNDFFGIPTRWLVTYTQKSQIIFSDRISFKFAKHRRRKI